MDRETLNNLREALARPGVTLGLIAELSEIPKATLHDMSKPGWGEALLERGDKLKGALAKLDQNEAAA